MIIFRDAVSGDEMFTDAANLIRNNGIIEINSKKVTESNEIDDKLIGGNASAEEAAEGAEGSEVRGYDLAIQNRLQEMPPFDKKTYMTHIKDYLKKVKAHMKESGKSDEEIATFQTQASEFVKKACKNIKECEIFVGEGMNPDGMHVIVDYREDGETAFFQFFEAGLIEEKA